MPFKSNKYVIALAGPTAVGKTECAIALAQHFNTVILSADSRQVFRQLSIGTAKPTFEQLAVVPHHYVGHLNVTDTYSAGRWAEDALALLDRLFEQHDTVVVTGGSGLYFKALLDGFDDMPAVPDEVKDRWEHSFQAKGIGHLQEELSRKDPDYFESVDQSNPRRLLRALSVIDHTERPFSSFRQNEHADRPFAAIRIFCNRPREELYERINQRVDNMMADGLLDEVRAMLPHRDLQALQTVGYRELFAHLDGDMDLTSAVDKIKQHTRNYAKRQVTWFSNQGDWKEISPPDWPEIVAYINRQTTET